MTDSNQQHGDEAREFSRRAVLGAVGASALPGTVGARALPGTVGARALGQADGELSGAELMTTRSRRSAGGRRRGWTSCSPTPSWRARSHPRRSLISMVTAYDPESGAIVASIIPLAKARRGEDEPRSLSLIRDSVMWMATRHATEVTHVMGEFCRAYDTNGDGDPDEVRSIQGQPHIWEQTLFYPAALEAFPPADLPFEPATPESVTGALQEGAAFERSFLSATGERSADGRFFTAGRTNQIDLTISSLTHEVDGAREVLPAGWEVVTTGVGVSGTTVTVEIRSDGTDEEGFVAVSGTRSTEYVLGQSTAF